MILQDQQARDLLQAILAEARMLERAATANTVTDELRNASRKRVKESIRKLRSGLRELEAVV